MLPDLATLKLNFFYAKKSLKIKIRILAGGADAVEEAGGCLHVGGHDLPARGRLCDPV